MIYDLFVQFSGVPAEMLAESPTLQKCFAVGAFGLACFALVVFAYMLIIIFRGWK